MVQVVEFICETVR